MLALRFSNASCSSVPHLNVASLWVSSLNGAVSDEYLGINQEATHSLFRLQWVGFFGCSDFVRLRLQSILCESVSVEVDLFYAKSALLRVECGAKI